jgi:hypothetical protein
MTCRLVPFNALDNRVVYINPDAVMSLRTTDRGTQIDLISGMQIVTEDIGTAVRCLNNE